MTTHRTFAAAAADRTIRATLAACVGGLMLAALAAGCGPASPQSRLPDKNRSIYATNAKPRPRDEFERSKDAPINANTHFAAAQLAETQESPARAEEQYKKALALDPRHQESIFRLGVLYAKQRRFGEALQAWNQYLKLTNGDPTGYANLGFCLELAGRSDEAEAAYIKGIRRDPTNAPCRVNYGLMLARHGKFNEGMLEMQAVLPEPEVHYNLASVYEALGRREQAKVEYKKALAADPQMKEAQARLETLP
jgi:tetratricopeptide (TPR) repeat protein